MADAAGRLPRWAQWGALTLLAAALAAGLGRLGLPASLLLGPMVAAILFSLLGGTVRLPKVFLTGAQSLVGCLVATLVTPAIVDTFLLDWWAILAAVFVTVAAASATGWVMTVRGVLPGTTAIWGTSPGGASAMVLMAEAFGADARLVALMQYLRVVLVALAAALVAHGMTGSAPPPVPGPWFPAIHPGAFGTAIALAAGGAVLGRLLRLPAGAMLLPLAVGAALHSAGLVEIQLPPWLMALCYGAMGYSIGLGFTRKVLAQAAAALPQILLSILLLMAVCGLTSVALSRVLGLDALTAYLAMSPGGMDSMAVIGAASGADMSFVMALQVMRLIVLIAAGPALARRLSRGVSR